jgi:coenzyme F420-dependent glucose-6-phosphate dehydrogenase
MQLGYALSSEEHPPQTLVGLARYAEEVGFRFALVSDHFHPWTDRQGNSPFVWSVLGAIAVETKRLMVGTGVTCPLLRLHPAIVAHAAATVATMMPGRFFLGVGTGENLNEHVVGKGWPAPDVRLEMLEEAIDVMRALWEGRVTTRRGTYFTVERARLYTRPDEPPPIFVAAAGKEAAQLAANAGDGLIAIAPARRLIDAFADAGGHGPRYGQITVCWAPSEDEARHTAHAWWSIAALAPPLMTELAVPKQFEVAAAGVREDDVADAVVCGPDAQRHLAAIRRFTDAGFDHVYVHQVGPDQEGFFRFYQREVLPRLS